MTKLTKEEKKSLILNYLDTKASSKDFNINNFTIYNISKELNIKDVEVISLVDELIEDGDVEKEYIGYDAIFPTGEYKELKKFMKKLETTPIGMDRLTWLLVGGIIVTLIFVCLNIYNNILNALIGDPIAFIFGFLFLILFSYFIGYYFNELYKKLLKKNDAIRKLVERIKPVFFTGLIIWIIMLIPFCILFYYLEEQYKIWLMIYLLITFPTTIIAAVEYQKYSSKRNF